MLPILALSALLPVALAQYNYPAGSSSSAATVATPTKQASSALQTITVGKNGLKFDPESLVVASGSKVVFEFYPGHHSVVQGSFDKPCSPSSGLAFYSGFVDATNGPAVSRFCVWVMTVSLYTDH
jgi:plastocyanin